MLATQSLLVGVSTDCLAGDKDSNTIGAKSVKKARAWDTPRKIADQVLQGSIKSDGQIFCKRLT